MSTPFFDAPSGATFSLVVLACPEGRTTAAWPGLSGLGVSDVFGHDAVVCGEKALPVLSPEVAEAVLSLPFDVTVV